MTIIWSENARNDIYSYKQNSKTLKVEEYIKELIDYTNCLQNNPKMGKFMFNKDNLEVRQLIFHMHRIFYIINGKTIMITNITHTTRKMNTIVQYLNNYLDNTT